MDLLDEEISSAAADRTDRARSRSGTTTAIKLRLRIICVWLIDVIIKRVLIVRHWLLKMFIKEEDTHLFANENDAIVSPLDGRVEEMIPVSSNTRSAHSLLLLSQSNHRERTLKHIWPDHRWQMAQSLSHNPQYNSIRVDCQTLLTGPRRNYGSWQNGYLPPKFFYPAIGQIFAEGGTQCAV